MIALVRAGFFAALVGLLSFPLLSLPLSATAFAQKAFQRDELGDAAIKLEAQIKAESGQITRNAATLRRDADAAFARAISAPACNCSGSWRLSPRRMVRTGCGLPRRYCKSDPEMTASARPCWSVPQQRPTLPSS